VNRAALAGVAIAVVVTATASAAQLYRWVDEKGRVEWRDTPPPADAKTIEQRKVIANTIDSSMPYALQQAIRKYPVTLWSSECGEPCSQATAHLARRGIPYTARDGQKEADALQKATGGREVPVLFVGSQQLKGYLESAWDTALDEAGYPQAPLRGLKSPAAAR
jgi:glutaredoxin